MIFQKMQMKYSVFFLASIMFYINPAKADSKYPEDPLERRYNIGSVLGPNGIDLSKKNTSKAKKVKKGYKVLYQAAIDYLSDRNIISANYEGGDIITDWCQKSPQDTQREVKVTILITGDKISKESLLVKAFSRLKNSQKEHK